MTIHIYEHPGHLSRGAFQTNKKKVGQQLIMYTLTQLSKLNYITLKEECAKGDDFMAHISVIYSRQI